MGIPMGVVIWSVWIGLGAQGAKGQDEAHHQDNAQPSFQVHSLTLHKKILQPGSANLENVGRKALGESICLVAMNYYSLFKIAKTEIPWN